MPKGFNEREKVLIKDALIEKGRLLFGGYGLKKTGIADLTGAVGIAQGSFYNFYESKEALYFEILELEEQALKAALFLVLTPYENRPREYLKMLLRSALEMLENYPLMTQLYLEDSMRILVRKLPAEKLEKHFNKDHADLLPFIEKWQAQGILRKEKPEAITGLLRSLILLSLHKKTIGEAVYEDTITLFIDLISEGLVLKED
ncbi:MAG TPA: TetR/AcrR family transcriptional regulator [Syntrophomonadaceae bacterium]|nr:TetR/AcrR family transcriptional regulator [Syntrophomonadaceae bacterium]